VVHFALIVLEDSQVGDFSGQEVRIGGFIALGHTQQYVEAGTDGAYYGSVYRNTASGNPLNDCNQRLNSTIMILDCVIGRCGIILQLPPSGLAKNNIVK
jgi:hypothetical protein